MNPIQVVLPRLHKVKSNGAGKWIACCPAHDDRSPSLTIRETSEGKVILHCFGGCCFEEIASAIGLKPQDFFPVNDTLYQQPIGPSPEEINTARNHLIIASYDRRQSVVHCAADKLTIRKAAKTMNKARRLGCL